MDPQIVRGEARIALELADDRESAEAVIAQQLALSGFGDVDWTLEPLFANQAPGEALLRITRAISAGGQFALAQRLLDTVPIRYAEPDLPVDAFGLVDPMPDEDASVAAARSAPNRDWTQVAVRLREAWALEPEAGGARYGAGVSVGHPDTGYTRHFVFGQHAEALDLDRDWDVLDNDPDAVDSPFALRIFPFLLPGHGTGTGSVIAGGRSDEFSGLAPAATLVPVRTMLGPIQLLDSDVARAVEVCIDAGCAVISMSLGGMGLGALERVIQRAVEAGIIVMAAAGNGAPWVVAPASYENTIAVAATNADDEAWPFSSRGPKVLISAPGQDVSHARWDRVTREPGIRDNGAGTSFAVAHVAGAAALWLAFHGGPDAMRRRYPGARLTQAFQHQLFHYGRRVPAGWPRETLGAGILDVHALLAAPLPALDALEADPRVDAAASTPVTATGESRLAAMLPDLSAGEVAGRLPTAAVGPDPRARALAAEILYLLMTDDTARDAFIAPPVEGLDAAASWRSRIAPHASPELRAALRS